MGECLKFLQSHQESGVVYINTSLVYIQHKWWVFFPSITKIFRWWQIPQVQLERNYRNSWKEVSGWGEMLKIWFSISELWRITDSWKHSYSSANLETTEYSEPATFFCFHPESLLACIRKKLNFLNSIAS